MTDFEYRNLKPSDKEQVIPAGEGLYVRVRSISTGGGKSFRLSYRYKTKQKWLTLNTEAKTNSLKLARQERDRFKAILKLGIDPSLEKKLVSERNRKQQLVEEETLKKIASRMTVRHLFDQWEKIILVHHKDKGHDTRRIFEKDVLPALGELAIEDIRKIHILQVLDTIKARGVNRMPKIILSLIRQMFRFAQDRDYIEFEPTSSIRKANIGKREIYRDRYLSDDEIKMLKAQLPLAGLNKNIELALWIQLSTCCRIGELSKAKWKDINLENGIWIIPAEHSKNGKAHIIQLSTFSIKQFALLFEIRESEAWLYPNRTCTDHIWLQTINKQYSDRQLKEDKKPYKNRSKACFALNLIGSKWTAHDLRRTGATIMGTLGVRPDVIELCLNHIEQNRMRRTYQHQSLKPQQKEAWSILGAHLEKLTD